MPTYETKICIDGDTFTEFEVDAVFDIDVETYRDERGNRAADATSWNLLHINLNGFHIGRYDVERIVGRSWLEKIEMDAVDAALEDYDWMEAAA